MLIAVPAAHAQFDEFAMIDAGLEPSPDYPMPVSHHAGFISPQDPPWSFDAEFLGLIRNDKHTIIFAPGPVAERIVMQSDSMGGLRLAVSKSLGHARGQTQAGVWEAGVVWGQDENRYLVGFEDWIVESQLTTIEANGGLESTVFGVRTRMLVGGRYTFVGDEYYLAAVPGFAVQDDLVEARNHAGYAQGKLALNWEYGRWSIAAALAGGFGLNAAHQAGDVFAVPFVNAYESDEWTHSMLTELTARASVRIFSHTHFQVGFYGLTLSEMASSRRGLGGEGSLDDASYVGLSLGVRQCF
ncbi:hypothetical protein Pla100_39160 [Neorhodopirellula pilleata]|uniref:Uncharacterized protein n=2 Tax=Neorhodopirellula pilleata TaxID=2714738 RepID=A0A5C6A4I6_9BACT|nr:hypothetical protein Pla100_39160 [Neorhodopirellula pilleata]